jgi:hypothetical protein
MLRYIVFLSFITLLLLVQSCGRQPYACFRTEPEEDNIHVHQPVTFRANCSTGADSYFWEFYDKEDSTEYGFSVTKTFKDTGEVKVFLLVVGGGKTSSTQTYIKVKP